jgi:hypothetical protein
MMKNFEGTETTAVQALINWREGKRSDFPEQEIKDHFNLFNDTLEPKEHKAIAAQSIAIKCLGKLSKTDVQKIDKRLERLINLTS